MMLSLLLLHRHTGFCHLFSFSPPPALDLVNQMVFIHKRLLLNAKNLAPLSISIFFWFKTDYFKFQCYSDDVPVSKDYFCHNFECLGMPGNSKARFFEKCQNIDFLA